nr:hypothetical protein [uncultured Mediterranean phage uvMED]
MATITFDPQKLIGPLNELVKVQIPETSRLSLNEALFANRKRLQDEANRIFKQPVPFTLNSFLFDKAEIKDKQVVGRAYVRDDAPKGNAPSRYLNPQIRGGPAYQTRFPRALLNTVVTQIDGRQTQAKQRGTQLTPVLTKNSKVSRNRYGNMSQGQYTRILSSIKGGKSSADFLDTGAVPFNSASNYFYIDREALDHPFFRNRFTYPSKPGIYKAEMKGKQQRFYRVMTEGRIPAYESRFKFFDISEETVTKEFVQRFQRRILR